MKNIFNSKATLAEASRKSTYLKKMSPEELRKLQMCLFDIYKDIKRVCDKYGLKVFLIGGSALGAVRHNGFIPWDDDMDLSMTRKDYEKFASVFEKELSDKYILNAPNYSEHVRNRFPIVMKKDTYYRTLIDSKLEEHHHINVEIFVLENTPDNKYIRKIKGTLCNFLSILSWEVFVYENRNEQVKEYLESVGKVNYYSRIIIGGLFSFRSSSQWFNTFDKAIRCKNEKSECCCLATGRKRYFGEIMRREQWLPGQTAEFEGEEVLIFTDKDPYLRNLYGDYMKLPPEDKRELHTACEIRL